MDLLGDVGSAIMTPLYYGVSAVLLAWHWLFALVLPDDSGWNWALAIVGLTVTIRAFLIPMSIGQIRSSRAMQRLHPQIKELQQKYRHDRKRLAEEQKKFWKESGTNPFSSCTPLLVQLVIFFALFRVIELASSLGRDGARGFLSPDAAASLSGAELLGTQLSDTFASATHVGSRVLVVTLVVIMCVTLFLALRQMRESLPTDAMNGPYAQQQKLLLYALPVTFAIGGFAFPVAVLIYWTTWFSWSLGEHSFALRSNPGRDEDDGMEP